MSDPIHLVLHVSAGDAVGYGHLARSQSLAELGRTERHWTVDLVVEAQGHLPHDLLPPGAQMAPDRSVALDLRASLAPRDQQPTVLATDLADRHLAGEERAAADGFAATVLLNATVETAHEADLAFLREPSTRPSYGAAIVRTGLAYEVVRREAGDRRPATAWNGAEVSSLVATFGGSDPGHLSEQLLGPLEVLRIPQARLVLGPGVEPTRRARLAALAGQVELIVDPPSLPDLLLAADLVVSCGGQTILEALHLGRPVAAVRWSTLASEVRELAERGLLVDLGEVADVPTTLPSAVQRPDQLRRVAAAGWRAVDGLGGQRCLEEIESLVRGRR